MAKAVFQDFTTKLLWQTINSASMLPIIHEVKMMLYSVFCSRSKCLLRSLQTISENFCN